MPTTEQEKQDFRVDMPTPEQEKQQIDHNSLVVDVERLIKQHYLRKGFLKKLFRDSCCIS
jgi:hypothetical protein